MQVVALYLQAKIAVDLAEPSAEVVNTWAEN